MQQTGLFSAVVATLLTVTVFDLKSNSQDTSTFYLHNMYQIQLDPNISRASIPSEPPPFSPPTSAIWVNALLFLSLLISLTCALLATLLQQWARRYVGFTQQPEYSPHRRARLRAFFSEGVDKSHISLVVEALPALLHLSICLFFAGLLVWLFNINHRVFLAVNLCTALSAVAYLWFTFSPIFRPNSPYYAPLSSTIWSIYTGISFTIFNVLSSSMFGTGHRFDSLKKDYRNRLSEGIGKTAEKTVWQSPSEIDVRILISTLDAQGEDGARAKFFEVIPGFFDSKHVVNLESLLLEEFRVKFRPVLNGFLDRNFSSGLVSEPARSTQLLITCLNAAYKALGPDGVSEILFRILNGDWVELLQSVEVAYSLRRWSKSTNDEIAHYVRRIVTRVVAGVRERDDRWISLAKAEFGVPDPVLRDHIGHGDSALLCLLIHMTRQAFRSGSWTPFILESLAQFDIRNTVPELQHGFCALWNEIVQEAWRDGVDSTALIILREVRHAYIRLHEGTDAAPTTFSARTFHFDPVLAQPLSYRFCNITSHRLDSTPQGPTIHHLPISLTRVGLGSSAESTTLHGGSPSPNHSPRPSPLELFSGSASILLTIPSKANVIHTEEANTVSRSPSYTDLVALVPADHSPLLINASLPPSPSPVDNPRRVLPVADPSVPKGIRMAGEIRTNSAYPEHTTPESCSTDTGERSQASVVASLPSPHPDPGLTPMDPSTGLVRPPSLSVAHQRHVLEASQCPDSAATLPRPSESNQGKNIAAPWQESDISDVSLTANHMPQSILRGGATLDKSGEVTVVPATSFPGLQLSPIPTPAICSDEAPVKLPSPVDPPGILSNHFPHTLRPPSGPSTGTRSYTSPSPSSIFDVPDMPNNGALSAVGGTSEMERPIPLIVLSDFSQSAPPALGPVSSTQQPKDPPHGV